MAAAVGESRMQAVVQFQNWPASVYVLLFTIVVTVIVGAVRRPSLPKSAPKLLREGYPILGMLRFFSDREGFCHDGARAARTGNFSFYFGKHHIVGVSGLEGRKTFFESKELSMTEGYAVLFTTAPAVQSKSDDPNASQQGSFDRWFSKTITNLMRKENFVKNLPLLVGDARARLDAMVARTGASNANGNGAGAVTGIFDPFDDIYRIVYQLTMRTVGANDIAESPKLLEKTLLLFEKIEASNSPTRIIFPWLPTPAYLKRMAAGAQLYMIFNKIAEGRRKTGQRNDDALQFLLDNGDDMVKILSFILGALFAGQLNSGINSAWILIYLACNPEWYSIVQNEVDSAVARHRVSAEQSASDILGSLTVEEWESDFPMIDLCLRETIRFQAVGTAFRKNISGKDVPIGKTGEILPRDAFAVYLIDEVHMNPEVYTDPSRWDPGRFLPDRAEDKKTPLSYLGWGTGRHPCLGMRFAKLEMGIIGALFVSMFDYELVDLQGNKVTETPGTNRKNFTASKPSQPMRLRYTVRQ